MVITEDAQRFAQQMEIELFETSAKNNIKVEEMFLSITRQVLQHKLRNAQSDQQKDTINLKKSSGKKKSKCCS